jgi:4-amino-4-deoxy-L-arabinose transferase-like glycosyltransferase
MPDTRFIRRTLLAILLLGLFVRLAAALWWQQRLPRDHPFLFGDSESYWHLARAIARGGPYQYGPEGKVFRTPGYPLVLASLFVAGRDPPVLAARALSALCGTAAIGAVYWLAALLFDRRVALSAAAIVALYPGAIALSVVVLSEAPFAPVMVLHLALWVASWRAAGAGGTALRAAIAGLAAAAAALLRPSWLLFVPFVVVVGLAAQPRRKHLLIGLCMLAGLALGMLPWWVRNWRVTGHFVPTTLQVGASLYDGLNPRATGASDMSFVESFRQAERSVASSEPLEYRLDRRLRRAAIDWAARHPLAALRLAMIKFVRLWNVWPNEPTFRSWPLRLMMLATYAPLLAAAVVGAWRTRRAGLPWALCWLPACYISLLHVVFVSSVRYREPAMLPLAVLAAASVLGAAPRSP